MALKLKRTLITHAHLLQANGTLNEYLSHVISDAVPDESQSPGVDRRRKVLHPHSMR
jgi:hypothetical protein